MTAERQLEKGISEIVGAFTDPIIVWPGGWGDTLPEWLKGAITLERLIENVRSLKGEPPTGTDAEVCAYLMTASLTFPLHSDWSRIYLYVAGQVMKRHNKTEIPPDVVVESLNDYQLRELRRLKDWLYEQRTRARQEKDRAERREKREEAAAKKKTVQPALFDL